MSLWQGVRAWFIAKGAENKAKSYEMGLLPPKHTEFISLISALWRVRWGRLTSHFGPAPSLTIAMLEFSLQYVDPAIEEAAREKWAESQHHVVLLFWAAILVSGTHTRGQLQAAFTEMGTMA